MRKQSRAAAKSPRKSRTPARRLVAKKRETAAELSPDEVTRLEQNSQRCEQSERAWQRMTAPPAGDDTWNQVEDHLLDRVGDDQERRWKYFSK